ncbi:MAG: hypothetical protein AAB932_00710 [Patescibacteria group bacterium]
MIHRLSFIEKIILRFNVFPHPFVDALLNIIAGRAIHVAVKMGIFDFLETKEQISLEEMLTERLKETLAQLGQTVTAIPQLGSTTAVGGSAVSYAIRRIANAQPLPSGRYIVPIDELCMHTSI